MRYTLSDKWDYDMNNNDKYSLNDNIKISKPRRISNLREWEVYNRSYQLYFITETVSDLLFT